MVESAKKEESKRTVTEKKGEVLEVENVQFHPLIFNRNKSPFVNQALEWDDKSHFDIPEGLLKGIKEELIWPKPSRIQGVAIPYILTKDPDQIDRPNPDYISLIAQARNGAGKTGAFVIGSILRVDPKVSKTQIICVGHTRELVNQTFEVYKQALHYSPGYTIANLVEGKISGKEHIVVTTIGKLLNLLNGRPKMDLSALKMFILDEADKKHGKHVFRDDVQNYRAQAITIFNLNYEEPKTTKKKKLNPEEVKAISFETPEDGIVKLGQTVPTAFKKKVQMFQVDGEGLVFTDYVRMQVLSEQIEVVVDLDFIFK